MKKENNMNEKRFLDMHVLISHSPCCLNRDDSNMQKSVYFGGIRRTRISSQCFKRAVRKSDCYKENFDSSVRTRIFVNELVNEFAKDCQDEKKAKSIEESGLYLAALIEGKSKPADIKKYKRADSGQIECQILPFVEEEMQQIRKLFKDSLELNTEKKIDFLKKGLTQIKEAMKGKFTLDVAISGRMSTSDFLLPVDGAVSVQHGFTTHAEQAEIDWFTAVDELQSKGSGHLDTQGFGAGVFYRYASLNIDQLSKNMGIDRSSALDVAARFVRLFATVVPTAKQRAFAAYNLADLVMVSFSDFPLSAANAFEKPVQYERPAGGYLRPSIKALDDYMATVYRGYGIDHKKAVFCLWDLPDEGNDTSTLKPKMETLEKLEEWVRNNGEEKK